MGSLVSERIGQFFLGHDRLEYTEYGSGDRWVVLIHGQLMPRTMHQRLARAVAAGGFHVVALDLLGHGRSDRPADPRRYSMTDFGEQVIELLDHLGADQAVIGGTSLGANVALEAAVAAPDRIRGLILEMPVLDNSLVAGMLAFAPLMLLARALPFTVNVVRRATRAVPRGLVPFWMGVGLDTLNQEPRSLAAALQGVFFGRIAPGSKSRSRIQIPALVVGHPHDPIHTVHDARMLADELPRGTYLEARHIMEWRRDFDRLDGHAIEFIEDVWSEKRSRARPVTVG